MQEINVVNRGADLMHHVEKKAEFLQFLAPPGWIEQEYPPSPLSAKQECDADQRIEWLRLAQLREWTQVGDVHLLPRIVQGQSLRLALEGCVADIAGEAVEVSVRIPYSRFQLSELAPSVSIGLIHFTRKNPIAMGFLGNNHDGLYAIHRNNLVEDLLDGPREARLDANPRQHARHQSFFSSQMLLSLSEIPQKQTHHQQVD